METSLAMHDQLNTKTENETKSKKKIKWKRSSNKHKIELQMGISEVWAKEEMEVNLNKI